MNRLVLQILLLVALVLVVVLAGARLLGSKRWDAGTQALRERLRAGAVPVRPQTVDFRELEGLPEPVQRYFRTTLVDGQPMIEAVHVRHRGTFDMGGTADRWRPFTSDQLVVTRRPGFDWDGRIQMAPGLPVHVHDAYVAGEGILHASLVGLVTVMRLQGTRDVAEGELMRFLAEAAWYPTALLPSQGVRWEAVDAGSARATLTDGDVVVTLLFTFDEEGLVDRVRAEERGRMVDGRSVPTPWEGRFWSYGEREGMRVPLEGEVAWVLPEGPRPYWRGSIESIEYEMPR